MRALAIIVVLGLSPSAAAEPTELSPPDLATAGANVEAWNRTHATAVTPAPIGGGCGIAVSGQF